MFSTAMYNKSEKSMIADTRMKFYIDPPQGGDNSKLVQPPVLSHRIEGQVIGAPGANGVSRMDAAANATTMEDAVLQSKAKLVNVASASLGRGGGEALTSVSREQSVNGRNRVDAAWQQPARDGSVHLPDADRPEMGRVAMARGANERGDELEAREAKLSAEKEVCSL